MKLLQNLLFSHAWSIFKDGIKIIDNINNRQFRK